MCIFEGHSLGDCPFRYQGQYEAEEVGLYYNRFRYYDPNAGSYISQDPIRLAGNNLNLYGYVKDSNIWLDIYGLSGSDIHRQIQERIVEDLRSQGKIVVMEGQIHLENGTSRFGDVVVYKDASMSKISEMHQVGDMRTRSGYTPSSRERGAIMDIRESADLSSDARIVFHDKKQRAALINPDLQDDWKEPSDKHRKLRGGDH